MNNIETLKNDIVFINDFATNLFGKTSSLSGKTIDTSQKLNDLIEIEKNNERFLDGVSESISDAEIEKTTQSLEKHLAEMKDKQNEYLQLINKNSKSIAHISTDIRNKKAAIEKIHTMCDKLEQVISLVSKPK